MALHQGGDLARARGLYLEVLRLVPDHADTLHLLGTLEAQGGHYYNAERVLRKAVARQPANAAFLTTLGRVQKQAGKLDAAIASLDRAVEAGAAGTEARFALGQAHAMAGNDEAAVRAFRELVAAEPNHARAFNELGLALGRLGESDEAVAAFEHAIRADPDYSWAHNNLGVAYLERHRLVQAQRCFENALRHRPDAVAALGNLALTLRQRGRLDEALAHTDRVIALAPDDAGARAERGATLQGLGRHAQARAAYDEALGLDATHPAALAGLAELDEWDGRYDDGLARLDTALAATDPAPCIRIAAGRLLRRVDRAADGLALLASLADPDSPAYRTLSPALRRQLHFTLGDLNDAVGDHAGAFGHYHRANEMHESTYDPDAHARDIDALIEFFDAAHLAGLPRALPDSDHRVFVVGSPRSGTTLVERILDSHALVRGVGEQPLVGRYAAELGRVDGRSMWPGSLASVGRDRLDALAQRYETALNVSPHEAARVVDKMPLNFLHLGFIELLFPQARVIHCVRDAADTCLSCYFQDFIDPALDFSFSLEHLAHWHGQYRRLMDHWRTVSGLAMLDVSYERLVSDTETVSREMVAFLGLSWDPACLAFHAGSAAVNTASHAQVRRPVYTGSVGRHRPYEAFIGDLLDGLGR